MNNCDIYQKDLKLTIGVNSGTVKLIQEQARACNIWVGFGFLELHEGTIYDSALLIDNYGKTVLLHRRLSPGWRAQNANPAEYGCAEHLPVTTTPFGKTAFLICGDLFEFGIDHLAGHNIDLILFPFARCFDSKITNPQKEWDEVEFPEYRSQLMKIGALTLMSNYIAPQNMNGGGFGGGFGVSKNGDLLAALPLFKEGLLIYDKRSLKSL